MTDQTLLAATEANQTSEGQAAQSAESSSQTAEQQQQSQQQGDANAQKPADQKPAEGEQKGGEQNAEAKVEGAPETYDFKSPEGVEVDSSVIETWSEVARELNLPQDKAQTVLDKMMPRIHERTIENHKAEIGRWAETSQKLPELTGGDGFDANVKIANAAIEKFGSEGLQQLLTGPLGLGNHPEIVAFAHRVGKALQPDGFVAGGHTEGSTPSPSDDAGMAKKLYKEQS